MEDKRITNGFSSISEILSPIAKKTIGKQGFVELEIITNWDKIVGEDLAKFSNPQSIDFKKNQRDNGTLHIQSHSGAFALEIKHKENYIIDRINSYFGYQAVSKLSISQSISSNSLKNKEIDVEDNQKILVSEEEEIYIKQITGDLENPKLKEALIKLGKDIFNNENNNNKNG